ncbi:hypothetical protein OUZ56_013249 [Daphnia magna]|uniref:Uncharacterized protein n=1 Tax=Daphnia magna TaxID=35525 RepID=A0ABQ9Z653_9CRUS|nr:hypothetical protein OUZ56_013249 [Daphnia magna]
MAILEVCLPQVVTSASVGLCLVMYKKPKRKAGLEESEIASRTTQDTIFTSTCDEVLAIEFI